MANSAQDGGRRSADRFWLGPIAGLVALILLGSAYFLLSRPHPPAKVTPSLVPVTVSEITSLTFHSQGKSLTLYQTSGSAGTAWHIGSPTGEAADSSLTGNFVGSLVTLTPDRTLSASPTAADLKTYGLTPPTASVAVNGANGALLVQLNVGVASPLSSYYVQVAGKPAVYLVSGLVPAEISANPSAWLPAPSASGSGAAASAASAVAPASVTTPAASTSAGSSSAASSSAASSSAAGSSSASGG